jgi:hypothetical protein
VLSQYAPGRNEKNRTKCQKQYLNKDCLALNSCVKKINCMLIKQFTHNNNGISMEMNLSPEGASSAAIAMF